MLVSAIVPTRDRAAKLANLLRRLARQTVAPGAFEVLVVDDGSREPVLPAVRALALPFACDVARLDAPAGPARARNLAIPRARAPLLLLLNDDVLPAEDLLERHLEAHARLGPGHAVLGTFWFTDEVRRDRLSRVLEDAGLYGNRSWTPERRLRWWCFWTPNLSVARDAVIAAGGFDERFAEPIAEDIELGLRLERAGAKLVYTPRALALHDHAIDLPGWMQRNERIGWNRHLLYEKYGEPSLLSDRDPQSIPDRAFATAGAAALRRDAAQIDAMRARAARMIETGEGLDEELERCLQAIARYDYSLGLLDAAAAARAPEGDAAEHAEDAEPSDVEEALVRGDARDYPARFARALAEARDDLVLVRDPRASVSPGAVARLRAHLEGHPKAAVVAPLLVYEHLDPERPPADDERAARRRDLAAIARARAARFAGESRPAPELLPACLLVRRQDVLQAGALHPGYRLAPYALRDLGLKLATLGRAMRVALDAVVAIDDHRDHLVGRDAREEAARDWDLFLSRWVHRRR